VDRRHLQAVAAEYPYLRGLTAVPAGLLFVVSALGNWSWGPFAEPAFFVVVALALIGVAAAVNRYYDGHYGRVTPSKRQRTRAAAIAVASVAAIVFGTMLLHSRASWSLDLPVNTLPVIFGAIMLVHYGTVVGLGPRHVVIWGTLVAIGLVPVWHGENPLNVGLVLTGAAVAVNGVFDHLRLVRAFGPPVAPASDPGPAGG
jgi:hypothetical protein